VSMSVDASLPHVVEAYDIDGSLTKSEIQEQYRKRAKMKKVTVGVVTARSEDGMQEFLNNHPRIKTNTDFAKSNRFKSVSLYQIKKEWPNSDKYTYFGSWVRDKFPAVVSGWDYEGV